MDKNDLFKLFEGEFFRPLRLAEFTTINNWIESDEFSLDLIKEALKISVVYQKVHMNYIQQILINWKKNNIKTIDEIDNYQKKHGLTHKKEQSVEAKMILEAMQHKGGVLGWIKENELAK